MHQVATKRKVQDPLNPSKQVEVVQLERRAYTRKHLDPEGQSGIKYYANSRMPREFSNDMPEYLAPPDAIEFYTRLESAKNKKRQMLQDARAAELAAESARMVQELPSLGALTQK
jgi:hypothetical protein